MTTPTFFWHDYETFGTDPQRDRACQFAGIRTDFNFNILGEPVSLYCKPATDCLPHPDACLITGISPQYAEQQGVCEAEFIYQIHKQLAHPATCTVGYNNIRFDDEVTRNLLYRNFYDPYEREWKNGNSRWDLIDVIRAARALRPDGIEWPDNEDGQASYRLEELTRANNIKHSEAHDALSDVYATVGIAQLIRQQQSKLFQFLLTHRGKHDVLRLLQLGSFTPVVHVSGRYPVSQHCLAVVVPLCRHPNNTNGVIVYDLSVDPEPLLELTAEQIRLRLFTATADLPEGVHRIPLKTIHVNKCPVVAPLSVIRKIDADRLTIDLALCAQHLGQIKNAPALQKKIAEVFNETFGQTASDPDLMIYQGGFFSTHDKAQINRVRTAQKEQLARLNPDFQDPRLATMLFRYKARNFPEILNEADQQSWQAYCREAMLSPDKGSSLTLQSFEQRVDELSKAHPEKMPILQELNAYAQDKKRQLNISTV